jgi:hypothetical protein
MQRVEIRSVPGAPFGTLARLAYSFVRGHIEVVATLGKLLTGSRRRHLGSEEEKW